MTLCLKAVHAATIADFPDTTDIPAHFAEAIQYR